jgi:hypothetical protein
LKWSFKRKEKGHLKWRKKTKIIGLRWVWPSTHGVTSSKCEVLVAGFGQLLNQHTGKEKELELENDGHWLAVDR